MFSVFTFLKLAYKIYLYKVGIWLNAQKILFSYFCLFEFIVLYKLGAGFWVFCWHLSCLLFWASWICGFVPHIHLETLPSLFRVSSVPFSHLLVFPWLGCYSLCSCSSILGYSEFFFSLLFEEPSDAVSSTETLSSAVSSLLINPEALSISVTFFFFNL